MSVDRDPDEINEICNELERGMEMLAIAFTAAIVIVAVAAVLFVLNFVVV